MTYSEWAGQGCTAYGARGNITSLFTDGIIPILIINYTLDDISERAGQGCTAYGGLTITHKSPETGSG